MTIPESTYTLRQPVVADGPRLSDLEVGEWAERDTVGVWRIKSARKSCRFDCTSYRRLPEWPD